jgi:hypothetical protein
MKRILAPILLALTFTVIFSSTSFADWKKVGENDIGDTYHVDFERIRKHGGYVYFWYLADKLKPDKDGDLSGKIYEQGDCKLFRKKTLSQNWYTESMGAGSSSSTRKNKNPQWGYPIPDSVLEVILKSVCAYAK